MASACLFFFFFKQVKVREETEVEVVVAGDGQMRWPKDHSGVAGLFDDPLGDDEFLVEPLCPVLCDFLHVFGFVGFDKNRLDHWLYWS